MIGERSGKGAGQKPLITLPFEKSKFSYPNFLVTQVKILVILVFQLSLVTFNFNNHPPFADMPSIFNKLRHTACIFDRFRDKLCEQVLTVLAHSNNCRGLDST